MLEEEQAHLDRTYAAYDALIDALSVSRRRRLDIEGRTVVGLVDEQLSAGEHDHLTEAIIEDITRQRVGEMRQIISTITPEQYALITEQVEGALVVQGGPGTGKTAVGLHRAAWLLYADRPLARAEEEERATLLGSGRMAVLLERLLWERVAPPAAPVTMTVARVELTI